MSTRRDTLQALAAGALAIGSRPLLAQDTQAISVLVGAASSMDFTARVIADQLQSALGRTAIAVPKLGAGQRVALGEARRAAPDGRTLVFAKRVVDFAANKSSTALWVEDLFARDAAPPKRLTPEGWNV
ncbi:MAG TPA: hypothetical protein VFO28_19415, partial [Burkholderiaceae bacterium]|nr:hypothetical protein [Burkholderiaceae bacterium]